MENRRMSTEPKTPLAKSVGIWLRVSTEDQAKGESPQHHEQRARLYAQARGWEVKEVYNLAGVSGKSVMDHPEAKRMLGDIRKGHITGLIFSKLARLARNTKELLEFSEIFRQHNADLISLQESIDTSTPAGRLFYTMIAGMSQWEREEIADRVKASVSIRAKLGKPLNRKAPFGYHFKDKHLVPHPQEAPIRKRMYELFLETGRIRTTARLLNEAGYRTRDNAKFDYSTVKRLIRNPTAKGVHIINFSKNVGRNKSWQLKPQTEWVELKVEPIISTETWEQANRILDDRSKAYKRPGRPPVQLFSGLTYCHCGQRMYPRVNTPKYVCSRCKNKIPIETLEAIFLEQLKGFFLSKDEIAAHLERATADIAEKERHLEAHRKELEKVTEEIQRIYQLYVDKQLDSDGFGKFYKPLEQRRKQLEDEEPKLQAELDVLKVNHLSADEILTEACDLYSRWPKLGFEDKRRIVESITEKIVIGKDDISITLCYLPSSEELTKKQRMLCDAGNGMAGWPRAPGLSA
jgi:site-specific DNA recombinase